MPIAEQQSKFSCARGSQVTAGDLHYLHFPAGIDGLRPGEQFKQMTVRIEEVDASAPFPII